MKPIFKCCMMLLPLATVTGCADFVQLKPGAETVNILTIDNVQDCTSLGSVQVSVLDKVGFIDRDKLAVENELNTMAKNSTFAAGGDTAMANGPVKDGARSFSLYKCKK